MAGSGHIPMPGSPEGGAAKGWCSQLLLKEGRVFVRTRTQRARVEKFTSPTNVLCAQ